jgi:AraC-like DNA-binding protein
LQDDRVETVLDYIHKNYGKKIYNNELASLAGFDYAYFIRLFEKTLGDTPQKYIAKYRLSKSLNFIREKMSLKEVAEKVGYEDVKVFCRAFKKHNGCTPAEYRKSHFLIP